LQHLSKWHHCNRKGWHGRSEIANAISFKKMKSAILGNGDEEMKAYYLQTLNTLSDQSNPVIISIEYNNF